MSDDSKCHCEGTIMISHVDLIFGIVFWNKLKTFGAYLGNWKTYANTSYNI